MQDVGRLLVVNNETEHYNVLDMKAPGLSASSPSPTVFTVLVEDSMFKGSNYDGTYPTATPPRHPPRRVAGGPLGSGWVLAQTRSA